MSFADVRLPVDVEKGVRGGPIFRTNVVTLSSGKEQRNQEWSRERFEGEVSYGIRNRAQFDEVRDFFMARRGRLEGFRYKDWTDYSVVGQDVDVGDGVVTTFQLVKSYGDFVRKITRPVSGTVVVYLDDVEQSSGYTVNHATGVITFTSAPGNGVVISADFEFDIPVRFDTDKFEGVAETPEAIETSSLPIVGIKE